jgi:iron complex outermembrane receptor protein
MRRLVATILLGAPTALWSQSDTVARRDTALLAPTVVTVTRTSIELSRAPFAVGVTHRAEIQRGKPGLALDEALTGIAGVQVDNRFNYALGERISIRGFGARAQFGVRGVRILLDGIPMTLADGQSSLNNVDVASVARAEVIRGPASALHGNAAGGVIQLETDVARHVTHRPLGGELRAVVGDHGLGRVQTTLGGTTGSTSYSLGLSRLSFGGYRQWNDARNDHVVVRLSRETERREVGATANFVDYDAKNPGGLSNVLLSANRDTAFVNNLRFKTGERASQAQLGGTWRERLGAAELEVAAHGLWRDVDNPIPQRIVVIDRIAGGARVALTGAPRFGARVARLSVGTELQVQRDDRRNYVNVDGARGADTLDQLERVTNTALFAQAAADVAPRLLVMLGGRVDRIAFDADDRLIGPGNADDSGERTMSAVSPSVGVTWSVVPSLDVYSNFSTSFETPTTSELANQESGAGGLNSALQPQRTRSAEVGLNGRVRLPGTAGTYQVAVYDARVRDALIPFELASVPGRQYFRNAGSTKHRGIEAAASLALPARLTLRASFAHTDARFDRYAVTSGGTTATYDGKRVPGVAANRADATLSFQSARLFVDLETRASSSVPVNDDNTERSPSYVVHGLRVGARDLRLGAVELAPHVGVLNLFDREYNTSVVVNAFGGRYYEPGPPRSVYGGVSARF